MTETKGAGHVVLEEGPDGLRGKEFGQAATREYWEQLWAGNSQSYGPAVGGHLPHQLRATVGSRLGKGAKVLEAGCGLSHFTVAMQARGFDATGLDWAEQTIERLRERFPETEFVRGDVRSSPFPDDHFDAVYSPGVCEHFEVGPDTVLGDAFRVLRPGGLAFVSTPHLNILRRFRWSHLPSQEGGEFYQYLFTKQGMTRTLERQGFKVIDATPYGTWATLCLEWPSLRRLPIGRAAAVLDFVPVLKELGATCIWTAQKPELS